MYCFVNLCTGGCDFEYPNICGFTQDLTDNFDWKRRSGATPSSDTGPSNDHTYGTSMGMCLLCL